MCDNKFPSLVASLFSWRCLAASIASLLHAPMNLRPPSVMYGHTHSKSTINRVRLPILHVVSWTRKINIALSAFAPENLVSRDGFGSPVPRQPAHLHAEAESGTGFLSSSAAAPIYLFKTAIRHRVSPELIGSRNCVPTAFAAKSPPAKKGPVNLKVCMYVWSSHIAEYVSTG